jgi:hypothetical protein
MPDHLGGPHISAMGVRAEMIVVGLAVATTGCAIPADETARVGTASNELESGCTSFSVTGVDYDPAIYQTRVEFRVHGTDLPCTLAFWVDQCRDMQRGAADSTLARFSCIPDYSVGTKLGIVRQYPNAPGGFGFGVEVIYPPH